MVALLFLLFGGITAWGQTRGVLTLDDAIRIALERSFDVQRATNTVTQSQTNIEQARANFLPSLSASVSPGVRYDRNGSPSPGSSSNQTSSSLGISASSSFNLFNGYADEASLRQARIQLTSATATLGRTREQVAYDAATQFIQILLDSALIRTNVENLQAERDQLSLIDALTTAGARPRADVFTQRAAVAAAELQLLNAQHDYELSVIRLKQLLLLDPNEDYTFVEPSATPGPVDTSGSGQTQTLQAALSSRADIAAQQARIAAAQEAITIAHAGALPTLGLSASLGTNYSSLGSNGFGNQLFDNPGAGLGLTFSLPIFDRRRAETNEELARIQYENELLNLKTLQQQASLEVQQAYLDYITAAKQLDVAGVQLASARESLEAQQERYRVGAATLAEVSAARAQYVQAEVSRAQAAYTVQLRQRAIEFYRGLAR